ncbi:MAG: replication-relaxation family protein [Solirubrobacteraceae bacterium]
MSAARQHRSTANIESLRPARVSDAQITRLAARLTERDRQIAIDCYEHHVLTTGQLQRLHFAFEQNARRRLLTLYTLRVLDRFRPYTARGAGSAPYHWVLDEAGAHIVAVHRGRDRHDLRWQRDRTLSIASSTKLTHHIEVNEFFARLADEAARAGGALSEWYGERTLHDIFDGALTPDSYGVITLPNRPPIHLLLELDRGTETTDRLREKATRYADILPDSPLADMAPLTVLAVPTPARARTATAAVAETGAPINVVVWSAAGHASALDALQLRPMEGCTQFCGATAIRCASP